MMRSRPRLLQISNRTLGIGGLNLAVERMGRLLAEQSDFCECLFQSQDWAGEEAPSVPRQALWLLHNRSALEKVLAAHREMRADVWIIHNWIPVVSAGIYAAASKAGVPIIQFVHNFRPFSVNSYLWIGRNLPVREWRRNFLREIAAASWQNSRLKTAWLALVLASLHLRGHFQSVAAWVGVSEFMRDQFIEAGLPPSKVFALRHSWTPVAQPAQKSEGDYYLFLGNLVQEKGLHVLIHAWNLVARTAGVHAPRLVIGGDGPLAEWVDATTRDNPLLEYRGVVTGGAKESLIAGCRALIAPSICREALGLVAYEAYDQARPVLAARSGGLTEVVQHGQTGMLHAPGNATELANHVLQIEREPGQRRKLGEAGREWLLANTRDDVWQRGFLEIVDRVKKAAKR